MDTARSRYLAELGSEGIAAEAGEMAFLTNDTMAAQAAKRGRASTCRVAAELR